MVANRAKNTKPEMRLRQALNSAGILGYATHFRIARTRVDVAFLPERVAVQLYGCFWHHCPFCQFGIPKTNSDYWKRHFRINRARDERSRLEIEREGWHLIELWEHDINRDLHFCVKRIVEGLQRGLIRKESRT